MVNQVSEEALLHAIVQRVYGDVTSPITFQAGPSVEHSLGLLEARLGVSLKIGYRSRTDVYRLLYDLLGGSPWVGNVNFHSPQAILQSALSKYQSVLLTMSGNEITDTLRSLGVEGDGLDVPGGVGIWAATTNLETNGGAETNTTGHTAGGTNTVERSTARAKFGVASFKCTYQDNAVLDSVALTLTAVVHSTQRWLYIPADYDGTQISVQFSGFTGATGTLSVNANMALRDQWQHVRVPGVTIVAGDLIGAIIVSESGTPTAGKFVYVDGCQTEAKAAPTPYKHTNGSTASRSASNVKIPNWRTDTALVQGWAAIRVRMGWTSATPPAGTNFVFHIRHDGTSADRLLLSCTSTSLGITRTTSGAAQAQTSAHTWAAGDIITAIFRWSNSSIGVRSAAVPFAVATSLTYPAISSTRNLDVGSVLGAGNYLSGSVLRVALGRGFPSDADGDRIAALLASPDSPRLFDFPATPSHYWDCRNNYAEVSV